MPELRFAHRLALRLGRTLPELSATLSAQEFGAWAAFFELESQTGQAQEGDAYLASLFGG